MKILQISDLHINEQISIDECKNRINKIYDHLKNSIKEDERLIFCICGDIIDKGQNSPKEVYQKAKSIFEHIMEKFKDYNPAFEFVPGNHDIAKDGFLDFDEFIKDFITPNIYKFQEENIIVRNYDDIDIILINSSAHKDYSYGQIDIASLEQIIESCTNQVILVTHHTLMSRYDNDCSSIRNAYKLFDLLKNKKVISLLHGHVHGYSEFTVDNSCKVIGIGSFLKVTDNVNNQFNTIDIYINRIESIENHYYRADFDDISTRSTFNLKQPISYAGSKFNDLYKELIKDIKLYGCINNFHLNLNTTTEDFFQDIEENFGAYIEKAKEWLQPDCPKYLHYNHAQYINKSSKTGVDYIVEELTNKATSSRAILPLINVIDVFDSGDYFLPSLDILQFGFDREEKDELFITVYFRALEVNHFLKINICEIYEIAKCISSKIRSIKKINLNIIAFRAQYKELFGCFKKAEIDAIKPADITINVACKDIETIINYLEEKNSLPETVIIDSGVKNLVNAIDTYNQLKNDNYYNTELVYELTSLVGKFAQLKELRKQTSIQEEIKSKEEELREQMQKTIEIFKKIRSNDVND